GKFCAFESLVAVIGLPSCIAFTVKCPSSVQLKTINFFEHNPSILSLGRATVSFDIAFQGDFDWRFAWTSHHNLTQLEVTFWDGRLAWCWSLGCIGECFKKSLHSNPNEYVSQTIEEEVYRLIGMQVTKK